MDKMVLITHIEYQEVPRDVWKVAEMHRDMHPMYHQNPNPDAPFEFNPIIQEEVIRGQRFVSVDIHGVRREICIGTKKEYQELLGMPLDAIGGLHDTIEALRAENGVMKSKVSNAEMELEKYDEMNLVQKIKFLLGK